MAGRMVAASCGLERVSACTIVALRGRGGGGLGAWKCDQTSVMDLVSMPPPSILSKSAQPVVRRKRFACRCSSRNLPLCQAEIGAIFSPAS